MKKILLISWLLVAGNAIAGERWLQIMTHPTSEKFGVFLDSKTLQYNQSKNDETAIAWIEHRGLPCDGANDCRAQVQIKYNCSSRTLQVMQLLRFKKDALVKQDNSPGKVNVIPPDSQAEYMMEMACDSARAVNGLPPKYISK